MEMLCVLIAAVLPALVLMWHIYKRDKYQREPIPQLVKGFLFGVVSIAVSLSISSVLGFFGLGSTEPTTAREAISHAFWGAGIPEETAKLLMLWLLLRRNRYYDERIDGIVYAVMVGMGFAMVENVLYLFSNYDNWLSVGITRAIFSVPGHFSFAVLMGYFYSKAHFDHSKVALLLTWIVPILLHGTFDAILFVMSGLPTVAVMGMWFVFIGFCFLLSKLARKKIDKHLQADVNSRIFDALNNYDKQ